MCYVIKGNVASVTTTQGITIKKPEVKTDALPTPKEQTTLNPNDQNLVKGVQKGTAATAVNFSDNTQNYKVKDGESLSSIAKKFTGSNDYMPIFNLNKDKLSSPNAILKVGTILKVPEAKEKPQVEAKKEVEQPKIEANPKEIPETYKVEENDNLSNIAKKFYGKNSDYMAIFNLNKDQLRHPNSVLKVGTVLKMPKVHEEEGQKVVEGKGSLRQYQKQNPLSYVTLDKENKKPAEAPKKVDTKAEPAKPEPEQVTEQEDEIFYSSFEEKSGDAKSVVHSDAVKVNRVFDLNPTMNNTNMPKEIGKWLGKTAEVLKDNKAEIKLGTPEKSVIVNAETLNKLAEKIKANPKEGLEDLKKDIAGLGLSFNSSMLAIDDIANNIKNDPYYSEVKGQKKTFDLAAVSDKFQIVNSPKNNYMANLLSHKHRQVPVSIEGVAEAKIARSTQSAKEIISDISKFMDKGGNIKDPSAFEEKVYDTLKDTHARRELIKHFNLNSRENIDALIPGITSEGGAANSQRDYNSYFAIGSVILNRALGKNIKSAAQAEAKGQAPEAAKKTSIKNILFEEGQFEVTWRKQGGSTLYDFQKSLNNSFKKGTLGEGNSKESLEIAYEVANDVLAGMNKLSAEVNGTEQKNSGRSTADLFYFNQSRSNDYSKTANADSAVALIDKNNTHVFFKAWDKTAYFR